MANSFRRMTGLHIAPVGSAWELMEPEILQRFLSRFGVDCVFDVGANNGQYGQRLRAIGFTGLIISFEPNPSAFAALERSAHGDARWIVRMEALDSHSREMFFNVMKFDEFSSLHEPNHLDTAAFSNMNVVEEKVAVVTKPLAEIYPKLKAELKFKRPFLKMDTQGHDTEVFRGAGEYVSEFTGLQSELSVALLYKEATDFSEAIALYRSKGFKMSAFVPSNAGHFPDLNDIDCVMYNPKFLAK